MINKYLLKQVLRISILLIVLFAIRFSIFNRQIMDIGYGFARPFGIKVLANDELLIGDFQNGSFEDGDSENPTGWTKVNASAKAVGKFSTDKEIRYIEGRSARIDYLGLEDIFWFQKAKLKPGKTYQFVGWIRTNLKMGDTNSWARFEMRWEDENGKFINPPLVSKKVSGDSNWQERIWTGQPPEGAVAVEIRALMTGNGTSWFDAIVWEEEKNMNKILFFSILITVILFLAFFIKRRAKRIYFKKNEKKEVNLG